MAMMSMQEFFYGESERAYYVHGWGTPLPLPQPCIRSRPIELTTFDLMVPMCCRKCEDEVRGALFVLSSVKDVTCDPYNQRVTVTGYLDPTQALQQVKRVKNGATFWPASSYTTHRYEASSHQKPQYFLQQDNRSYARSITREKTSSPDHYNRSSGGSRFFWSSCPRYGDSAVTHVVSLTPTIATRVEVAC